MSLSSGILESFARVRKDHRDRVAIHGLSEGRTLTFDAVGQEADSIASTLRSLSLPPGSVIVTLIGNRTTFVSTFLACLQIHAIVVPLDGDSTAAEALALVDRFGAAALIAAPSTPCPRAARETPLPNGLRMLAFERPQHQSRYPAGAALFKLTSGSTSTPKAVMATGSNLIADGVQIIEAMGIRPEDVNIAAIPLSHSYGIGNLLMPLVLQGTAMVLRDAFAPSRLFDDIRQFNATVMPGVPFIFEYIRQHLAGGRFPESMRVLLTAGARIDPGTVRGFKDTFGLKIHSFYGTSETGGIAYDQSEDITDSPGLGRPLPNVHVTFRELPGSSTTEGRLHVVSPAVSAGYAGDEEETRDSFVDGGFLTGDVGYAGSDGRIVLTGRVSRFINVAGRKVHPDEVARVLLAFDGVTDARVFGVADPSRGQSLVACVVADPDRAEALALRRHCAEHLAPYKIPRHIVVLRRLPVDARGKTDQRALEELVNTKRGD